MSDPHPQPSYLPEKSKSLRSRLRWFASGRDARSRRLQAMLSFVDLAILAFFLFGPFLRQGQTYHIIDYAIAAWIGLELIARGVITGNLKVFLTRFANWVDLFILATLLFPDLLFNFAFLRVMRLWALGNSNLLKNALQRLGHGHRLDVVRACLNLVVFLFIITGFVYTSFFYHLGGSEGFVDALYFTVATVTTTGFGDITLPGTSGKLTSVVTMIIGISLFVRLAQAVVRPYKVTFACPECGLQRHDADAVHCKACGNLLNISDEGL
ncbi:potassium channel family protein [Rhizobium tubonense]|uniref:Ion transporter n=1 Tax=Rhizobium tubonense TaxID=484088 RepID=A0A2W4CYD1_9HYPH|nr:potassium channel family protein [Rhizobium tubonense]PZM15758.1 ion transporter [Rhizobium tubonense]